MCFVVPQKNVRLINAVSPSTKKGYETAEKDVKGRHISHLVVSSLEPKLRKKGTDSDVYKKEQMYYKKLMEDTFYDLMVCISKTCCRRCWQILV